MTALLKELFGPKQNDSIMFTPRKERTFTEMLAGNILNSMAQKKTESNPPVKSSTSDNSASNSAVPQPTQKPQQKPQQQTKQQEALKYFGIPTTTKAANPYSSGSLFKINKEGGATAKDYEDVLEGMRSIREEKSVETPQSKTVQAAKNTEPAAQNNTQVANYRNSRITENRDEFDARVRERYAERQRQENSAKANEASGGLVNSNPKKTESRDEFDARIREQYAARERKIDFSDTEALKKELADIEAAEDHNPESEWYKRLERAWEGGDNATYLKTENEMKAQKKRVKYILENFDSVYSDGAELGEEQIDEQIEKSEKERLDKISNALAAASLVPGLDTFADLAAIPVDLMRGDYMSALFDLVGVIPGIGEAGDTAKLARMGIKAGETAGDVIDAAKAVEAAGDVYDAAKAVETADNVIDAAKAVEKTSKITSVADNAESIAKKYNLSKSGYFGTKGKNTRVFKSADPIKSSDEFYKKISKGGQELPLSNGKGLQTVFSDGSRVVYRVITKTPNSPAVSITVINPGKIKSQKIHFIK